MWSKQQKFRLHHLGYLILTLCEVSHRSNSGGLLGSYFFLGPRLFDLELSSQLFFARKAAINENFIFNLHVKFLYFKYLDVKIYLFLIRVKNLDIKISYAIVISMKKDHVDEIKAQWAEEKPEIDVSPMEIIGRISRISRHIDRVLQENYAKFGLNGGEFDVLATLRRSGKPYQLIPTEMFQTMMLSSGAMTNRLDRLEKYGLIERTPNPNDRRGVLVGLTKKGLELIDKAYPLHISHENNMLASLSSRERESLINMLRKMLISFEGQGNKQQ